MEVNEFIFQYQIALNRLTDIVVRLTNEKIESLKKEVDFNTEVTISEAGDKSTLGEFLQTYSQNVVGAFTIEDSAIKSLEAALASITDEEATSFLNDLTELFSEDGLIKSKETITQMLAQIMAEPSLPADFKAFTETQLEEAKKSGESFSLTPLQHMQLVFHGEAFSKLTAVHSLDNTLQELFNTILNSNGKMDGRVIDRYRAGVKTFDIALEYLEDVDFKSFDTYTAEEFSESVNEILRARHEMFLADVRNIQSNDYYRSMVFMAAFHHLCDIAHGRKSFFDVACEIIEAEKSVLDGVFNIYKHTSYPKVMVDKFITYCNELNPQPSFLSDDSEVRFDFFATAFHYLIG